MIRLNQNFARSLSPRKVANTPDTKVELEAKLTEFNPSQVNLKLNQGDMTGLDDLNNNSISYTQSTENGSKVIEYEYNGVTDKVKCKIPKREVVENFLSLNEFSIKAGSVVSNRNINKSSLPEKLTNAINSGDIELITQALDKLGISYVQTRDPNRNYQAAQLIKFIYGGKEYQIPCEYKDMQVETGMIDNSIESQLKSIVNALKSGHKEELEYLKKIGY